MKAAIIIYVRFFGNFGCISLLVEDWLLYDVPLGHSVTMPWPQQRRVPTLALVQCCFWMEMYGETANLPKYQLAESGLRVDSTPSSI